MLLASGPSPAPRVRRVMTLMVAAAATGGLAACGGSQDSQTTTLTGAKGEVQNVVQKLSDRAENDDAAGICRDLLSPRLIRLLGDAACPDTVQQAINASDYTRLNVSSVELDATSTTAVAQIKPVESTTARRSITLTRKSDAKTSPWLISALDPTGKTKLPAGTTPAGTTPEQTTPASTPKS